MYMVEEPTSSLSTLLHLMSVITRESNAIDAIYTDTLFGRCSVLFKNGSCYHYKNVSRRALLNLKIQPNISLGSWANYNLPL